MNLKMLPTFKKNNVKRLIRLNRQTIMNNLSNEKTNIPIAFSVTNAPMEHESLAKLPKIEKERIYNTCQKVRTKPKWALDKLLIFKHKYPCVPMIYNYIAICYVYLGYVKERLDTIIETRKKFPDYGFAKISLAEYLIESKMYKKIPEIFNDDFHIQSHFQGHNNIYHISEVRGFYSILTQYYLGIDKIDHALYYYFTLYDIEPRHSAIENLANILIEHPDVLARLN